MVMIAFVCSEKIGNTQRNNMEDFIITVIALTLLGGALYLNVVLQDTKAMDIMKKIFWPLIKLKEWVDPNHWANKLGEKSGAYDKARNSKIRKWGDSLEGWRWWTWQIVGGGITLLIIEFLLNITIGYSILPWRW